MRFTKKDENKSFCVVICGLNKINKTTQNNIELMFFYLENFKNDFVDYLNNKLSEIINNDSDLVEIQKRIDFLHKTEGKVTKESEKSKELRNLYFQRNNKIYKNKNYNSLKWMSDFLKNADVTYKIYLHDDIRNYGCKDVISSLEKFLKGEGKSIHKKNHNTAISLSSKSFFQKEGKTRSTMIQFEFKNDKMYALIWDLSPEYIKKAKESLNKTKRVPVHKKTRIRVHINPKDPLQKLILQSPEYGQVKLVRIWKGDKWKYQLQISVKNISPKVNDMVCKKNTKVAVDYGTETAAIVCSNGYMEIADIAPDTPRVTEKIKELDRALERSRIATNKDLYRENGTRISKKEMKERGLEFNISNNYIKLRKRRKTEYALLKRQRKQANQILAKHIFLLGDSHITEENNIKAWKTKIKRMNRIAKEKYDNNVRVNDYCEQIQDRAVAQIPSRINHLCNEQKKSFKKISGLNLSTYNHFSGKNDLFLHLNDRVIISNKYFLKHKDEYKVEDFNKTFQHIEYNGKNYILQRDLYSAAKMLYCYSTIEKKETKDGKMKEIEVWHFDNEGFSKFFDSVFYPKQEEYLKNRFKDFLNGKKTSGTIFGI